LLAGLAARFLVAAAFGAFFAVGFAAFSLMPTLFGAAGPGLEVSVVGAIIGSVVILVSPYIDVANDTLITLV
jgi:hypothetical protein